MINTTYNSNISELTKQAGDYLSRLFEANNKPILFLSSAGSAFPLLDYVETSHIDKRVTVGVLDERCDRDEKVNNFLQLSQTPFYKKVKQQGVQFIDTQVKNDESMDLLAERFEFQLKRWKELNTNGVIIATQGLGPDGHTSGIMPFPEDEKKFNEFFNNEEKWVVGYDATGKNQYPLRITTTLPFLRMINYSILFVTGESKRTILKDILEKKKKIHELPGTIIHEMKHVELFTDISLSS